MRVAVISDIHGNFEAFKEILKHIDISFIDHIVNLGDSIGYGPDPEKVLSIIEKRAIKTILGNHEQAILDDKYRQYFMQGARKSIEQTIKYLTAASISYLKLLPNYRVLSGALFVHGCPPDSNTLYLNHLTLPEIENALKSFSNKICFVGHTHRFMLLSYDGSKFNFNPLKEDTIHIDPRLKHIVSVGSVGQPRDRDSRAGYVIWDTRQNSLQVIRLPYDVHSTVEKILKRGFQKRDADRLFTITP